LAHLQGVGETAVSSAIVLLTDLPTGFAPYPVDSLGLLPGSSLSADTIIDRSFAFARQEPFVLVWGFTTAPMDEAQQAAFDARLQKDDLVAFIGSGLQAESVSAADTLPGSVGLADASVGVTAVFTGPGLEASVQGVAFRRGSVGAMIFVMTAAEETTQASALELAQLLANRITP